MPRVSYVNGFYQRHENALVHVEDRGYQFADGVYEVCAVLGGILHDFEGHWDRLIRSLNDLDIDLPMSKAAFSVVLKQMIAKNRLKDGIVYYQITRGVAPRDHALAFRPRPSLVVTAKRLDFKDKAMLARHGVAVITTPDMRWARCDIKSVSLLPNILVKEVARRSQAFEAWMVRDGIVTEGSSTNSWIVDEHGVLRTHPLGPQVLGGITRQTLCRLAPELGLAFEERAFTVEEAKAAREAFLSSSSSFVMPVTEIDGVQIGSGLPGDITLKLSAAYWDYVEGQTGVNYWR
ncbi:MAG: D-amino-acid transaminase [Sphingomonadales bacterium]|jgi:D-alanine transaminase